MLFQILFYIFFIISLIDVVHLGLYLLGANVYDYRAHVSKLKLSKPSSVRPLVSVLIPAHNEEKTIIRTLDSVRKSRLRKLEIIVIDDCSSDSTRSLVRAYIKDHPKRRIKILTKRRNVGKAEALNHGLKRGAKGSLVMMLDADSVVHPDAITNAVRYFKDPRVVGVAANVRIFDSLNVLGLLQKFEYLIGYRSKKFFTTINGEYIIGGVGSTYRMETLKKVKFYDNDSMTEDIALSLKVVAGGNKETRVVYGSDVIAMTEPVGSFKALLRQRYRWKMGSLQAINKYRRLIGSRSSLYSRSLSFYRLPMAVVGEILLLLEPLAIAFAIYVSIRFGKPTFLIGAYSLVTLFVLMNVWPDEFMSRRNKIKLSLLAPLMYFIFYIMNVVQFTAITRCVFNRRLITDPSRVAGSWVSPKREGQTQVQFS